MADAVSANFLENLNNPAITIKHPESRRGTDIEKQLTSQGINLSIPEEMLNLSAQVSTFEKDELTGMAVENDSLRRFLALEFSSALRNDENWMLIYGDADQLKQANTKAGRGLGDMVIVYNAAVIAHVLEKANLGQNVRIRFARQTGAADEVLVWIFGANNDELGRVAAEIEVLKPIETNIEVQDKTIQFPFSTTISYLSSFNSDPQINLQISETQKFLSQKPENTAWNMYNFLKDKADTLVKEKKANKEQMQLSSEQFTNTKTHLNDLIQTLSKEFGYGRINESTLQAIMKLVAVHTLLSLKDSMDEEEFTKVCISQGINALALKQANTVQQFVAIYDSSKYNQE